MDISKICNYKKEDIDSVPIRRISYISHSHDSPPSNLEIKQINRDIKIDILEGNKSNSDILPYNDDSVMGEVAIKIETMDVYRRKFNSSKSAYEFIIDKIVSIAKKSSSVINFDHSDESLRKIHFSLIKETVMMTKDSRRGININNCIVLLNPLNSNIVENSPGLTPIDIVYSNIIPIDELIISWKGTVGEVGINVTEVRDNTFYIADIKAEMVIRSMKLKKTTLL